jgi:hypothetical protein
MLSGMTGSVQRELDRFAGTLNQSPDSFRAVSAQAFSKARTGFSAQVFLRLNQALLNAIERHLPVPRWRGFRIVAADASKLQLFLKDVTTRKVREAIAFALYLPGLEMMLDFELYSPAVGERQMLFEHLNMLRPDALLVLDRGYPASWLVAVLQARRLHFCLRVDDTGFAAVKRFRRSGLVSASVTLPAPSAADAEDYECPRQPITVRLVRIVTPTGHVHILMTSLLDETEYPATAFGDLYHARWRIEEAFKRIKHRLALEQLSGVSWLAAQQDFGAKVLCDNLNALAIHAAAPELIISKAGAGRTYKINRTHSFGLLKSRWQRWLAQALPTLEEIASLLAELLRNLVAFIPGASKPRNSRHKPHRHFAYKSYA